MHVEIDINELISKCLLGEASDEEKAELDSRLAGDGELQMKISLLLDKDDFVSRYKQYAAIDYKKARRQFFDTHESHDRHSLLKWMKRIASVAAIVVVAMALWTWLADSRSPQSPVIDQQTLVAMEKMEKSGFNQATLVVKGSLSSNVATANDAAVKMKQVEDVAVTAQATETPEATLVTRHDKEFWMVLDDGTHVHLNYNSSLTYPMHFRGGERRVSLEGEAYFIVAKDSRHPFVVTTPNGDIRDYGTEFCVNTKSKTGGTNVVLVSGKVGVVPTDGIETILKPGEKAEMNGRREAAVSEVDIAPYVAWNTGQFFFDGCPLEELLDVIARWYNVTVEFKSDDIRTMRFTGNIDKYESILPTIHAIREVTGVDITLSEGKMVIMCSEQEQQYTQ